MIGNSNYYVLNNQLYFIVALENYLGLALWVIIGSGNGLSLAHCRAINWNKSDSLSIGTLGTNFNELQIKSLMISLIQEHSLKIN